MLLTTEQECKEEREGVRENGRREAREKWREVEREGEREKGKTCRPLVSTVWLVFMRRLESEYEDRTTGPDLEKRHISIIF